MTIAKNIKILFVLIFLSSLFFSNVSFANNENIKNVLSLDDVKIYKKIFKIQKLPIKSKKSKEWKEVDSLIRSLNNKILLGNVYAERFLHPTGWRSSYTDLKKWLDKYNDHPDANRIIRIALKRKPNNSKSPKKPTPGFLNGYGTYKANVLKPRFPIDNRKYTKFAYSTSIKFRRSINKKNASYAENLLSSTKVKK